MKENHIIEWLARSSEELEALLRQELEQDDHAAAQAILEELARRTPEDAGEAEKAWRVFQTHYLPIEGGESIYAEERKGGAFRLWRTVSAAAIAAMLACVLIVQAGGTNALVGTVARWTTEQFSFGDNLTDHDHEEALLAESGGGDTAPRAEASPETGEVDTLTPPRKQYLSFEAALEDFGLPELLPSYIPEGYSFYQAERVDLVSWEDLSVLYTNGEEQFLQFSYSRTAPDAVVSSIVEKDDTPVELYERDGVTYYFVSNLGYESVNWKTDELTECRVGGFVSREELKAVIDSMYRNAAG